MRTSITSQQAAFFTQNGYIELAGINFDPEEVFSTARSVSHGAYGRDLWRRDESLRRLTLRKLAPSISQLVTKPVRLACDQWMASFPLDKACRASEFLSIQGLVLIALFTANKVPSPLRRASAVGIPPFAQDPESVLFVKPNIVLDWPLLTKTPVDLYLVAYALPNTTVYIHNPKDPATHFLKEFGYEFGDVLTESTHPLIYHG